ncbi:hypothetical protein PMI37_02619, partial [Pseudomonas sp. GM80]
MVFPDVSENLSQYYLCQRIPCNVPAFLPREAKLIVLNRLTVKRFS